MLPYGTLWKLDQMLHPVGPPQRRTVAMRRRQALFYFLWGVLLVTIFLFPFHYASLRRLRLDGARRLRGEIAPMGDADALRLRQEHGLARLTKQAAGGIAEGTVATTSADFATVFYHHPLTEVRLRGMFHHPSLRELAGSGSGKLWRLLGGEEATGAERDGLAPAWRLTLAETASLKRAKGAQPTCLASLRRDVLVSRLGSAVDADAELLTALHATLQHLGQLDPITVSTGASAAPSTQANGTSIEIALARLFLWIANDTALAEDALSAAVANCGAPLSRAQEVSFDWQAVPSVDPPRTKLFATLRETAEGQAQYVCLCSGTNPAHAIVLTDATDGKTDEGGNVEPTLFLVDPRHVEGMDAATCASACL